MKPIKISPMLLLIAGLLAGVTAVFQACGTRSSDVIFVSQRGHSSDSLGRGDSYDGKPKDGKYYREVPDLKCNDKEMLYGVLEIKGSSVKAEILNQQTCATEKRTLRLEDLEYNGYVDSVVGFEDGVFEKRKQEPDLSARDVAYAEAWCRTFQSTDTSGFDIVVRHTPSTGQLDSSIFVGTVGQNKLVYSREIKPANVVRSVVNRKVEYSGPEFSLQFELPNASLATNKVAAKMDVVIDGIRSTADMECRVAGALDNKLPTPPLTCPDGYISVPSLASYTQSDFCVAKFESKQNGAVAESRAADAPWVDIDRPTSIAACQGQGVQYDLITNAEWQSVARSIEQVPQNWSGGQIGNAGGLNRGHSDGDPSTPLAASGDDNLACFGTGQTCDLATWSDQRRTHFLDNGEIIWDLAGNVIEWVKDNVAMVYGPRSQMSQVTGQAPFAPQTKDLFGPAGNYLALNAEPYGGLGLFEGGNGSALMRGGTYFWMVDSGIFEATMTEGPESRQGQLGFRCVYHP